MIKFFRQIRQSLLSEGKTRKYLLYAIGEILLVVVGILIALQVNNWNETRKEYKTENEFISSVRNDLNQDKEFIKLIIEQIEPRIEAFEVLNSDLSDLYQNDKNTLNSVFNLYFKSQRTFYPLSGSYESAVSGNQLTAFRNREWVEKVVRLYNSTYDRLIDNGRMLDDRWAFISKKYSYERRTGQFREMDSEQLTEFLDDIFHHYIQMEWYLEQLKNTRVEIDDIISEK